MGKASRAKADRKLAREELGKVQRDYWHGGAADLPVGEILVPGTRVVGYAEILRSAPQELITGLAPFWVYLTTDRDLALDFAGLQGSLFGFGTLYRVEPLAPLEPDPDFAHVPGVSYRVKRARVLEVHQTLDRQVPYSPTGATLRYATWDDGTPMYDDEGYPSPNATQRELGVSAADLVVLGRAADFEAINALAGRLLFERNPGLTQAQIDFIRRRHGGRPGETPAGRWRRLRRESTS